MTLRASTILAECSDVLVALRGDDVSISGLGSAECCKPGDLVFVDRPEFMAVPVERGVAVFCAPQKIADQLPASGITILIASDITMARACIAQRYFDRDLRPADEPPRHPDAVIHETAEVADSAWIGPGAVVGARVVIGPGSVLLAGVIVEHDARIGTNVTLHPGVVVGFACTLGDDVIVQAGTVIGSEGFGFAQDKQRKHHRIPQLGNVCVADRVRIGANCCIDRGTHGATSIGAGSILDNLCHVAHNVQIGEDCILTAMLCVAGSTKIGNRVVTSGQVGIIDHLTIGDDVYLLHRAGVTQDVKAPGAYAGVPLLPLKEHIKSQAQLRRLNKMREQIKSLEERLRRLEG